MSQTSSMFAGASHVSQDPQDPTQRLRHQEAALRSHVASSGGTFPHLQSQAPPTEQAYAHAHHHHIAAPQYAYLAQTRPLALGGLPTEDDSTTSGDQAAVPFVPDAPDSSKATLAGYDLLASHLSGPSRSVKPMYRKFEQLHHRIILHLQDEISELEEQLKAVDSSIAQMTVHGDDSKPVPASRRAEKWQGSELHCRKTHLLGTVFVKTEQYSKSRIVSFQHVRQCSRVYRSRSLCICDTSQRPGVPDSERD